MGRDTDTSIPLHRVAVLQPFANFLADVGAPVERGLQLAGLPAAALEDVNNYVPSHRYYAFLVDMARRQGIPNLGFHVGQKYGANCADPHMVDMLRQAPTIYHGLSQTSKFINTTVSNCQLGLVTPAGSHYSHFYHRPSCDVHNPALQQIGWFGVMTLLGMVRTCVGPHWQPSEIGLMTGRIPCREIRDEFAGTRFRLLQPYSYITLETALLGQPPLNPIAATAASLQLDYEALPKDFVDSLTTMLQSYIYERDLSIAFAASLCDMSKRSLQRKLAASGTHYSEILDNVRFNAACDMLRDPDMKVTEIAYKLGYNDSSHFSRAFRRVAGISPRQYQKQYQY